MENEGTNSDYSVQSEIRVVKKKSLLRKNTNILFVYSPAAKTRAIIVHDKRKM